MPDDPTRRGPGSWPRDRPIRWRGVARNLTWFLVASACLLGQLALAPWLLLTPDLPVPPLLALAWGAATLATTWAWVTGRDWVIVPPILTIALFWAAAAIGG